MKIKRQEIISNLYINTDVRFDKPVKKRYVHYFGVDLQEEYEIGLQLHTPSENSEPSFNEITEAIKSFEEKIENM